MDNNFYERTILILEDFQQDGILKPYIANLESPLNLARDLSIEAYSEFSRQLKSHKERIDSIKRIALGLSSAEKSASKGDSLASYALYQFAFQQFFQSSFRARQGTVLDKALNRIFDDNQINTILKKNHKIKCNEIGIETDAVHDIDVLGFHNNQPIIVQIRSRDDTGGTTAKGSLVEMLEDIRNTGKLPKRLLTYLIYIWEPLDKMQRQGLINRVASALKLSDDKKNKLENNQIVKVDHNIQIGVIYGAVELFNNLNFICGIKVDVKKYAQVMNILSKWDDLWLAYALITIELDNLIINDTTNFSMLNKLLRENHLKIGTDELLNYQKSSIEIAHQLVEIWGEDSLPFKTPQSHINYLRDLVLLKMIYIATKNSTYIKKITADSTIKEMFEGEYGFID